MVSWLGRVRRPHLTLGLRTEAMMHTIATLDPSAAAVGPTKDEPLYEVVNGQKVELPPRSIYAAWIASRMRSRIGTFAETHGLEPCEGETDERT